MSTPKSAPTTFRFQPEVKDALAVIAEREGRSMANMLEWLIKKHCEAEKLGWPPPEERVSSQLSHARAGPQLQAGSRSEARSHTSSKRRA
jgi:hypothetical protein